MLVYCTSFFPKIKGRFKNGIIGIFFLYIILTYVLTLHLLLTRCLDYINLHYLQYIVSIFQNTKVEKKKDTIQFYKDRKTFHLFLNSFSLLQVTAIYFSRLIFSRTSETKSSNQYVMAFKALTDNKYLPKIMRWLRAKQQV